MFLPLRRSFDRKPRVFATHSASSRLKERRAALRRRFLLEPLEGRQMLSTLYVSTAGDNGSNTNPLAGSLRAEILAADAAPAGTYTTIDFEIPGAGVQEIQLQSPLPVITNPVDINGLSQRGSSAASPLVQIDGTDAGTGATGLSIEPSASGTAAHPAEVSGLEITDFSGGGVNVNQASYVNLSNLFVGVTKPGTSLLDEGDGLFGVLMTGGSHDTLAGSVVSDNQVVGVEIGNASYDTLTGDFIGTDLTGELATDQNGDSLGNNGTGVLIAGGANHNTVTLTVISNNNGDGVELTDPGTDDNTVSLDFIGTDLLGNTAMPNQQQGVLITNSASDNTIGGSTNSFDDLISGNVHNGVSVDGGTQNIIEGDYIGTDSEGTGALANGQSGVALYGGATHDTVGGAATGRGDLISGNLQHGVWIEGQGTSDNVVEGDEIGTTVDGASAVPNGLGVFVGSGATSNTIGATTYAVGNLISGNYTDGVEFDDASDNLVEGDYIGTTLSGESGLGNGGNGVSFYGGACDNTVGGTTSGERVVIAASYLSGVLISDPGTSGNRVEGDYIGTNAAGTAALPNNNGVVIQNGATKNMIGGTTTAARDVISGNYTDGVHIVNSGTDYNLVEGDDIGTTVGGSGLGNGQSGVAIFNGACSNTVGGTASGSGDVISDNGNHGVFISDAGTDYNLVEGDDIGTGAAGTGALPNLIGVWVGSGATSNTIGGTTTAARDVISGNYSDGVQIAGSGTSYNVVDGDYIGTTAAGNVGLGNGQNGVSILGGATLNLVGQASPGAANLIAASDLSGVLISGPGTSNNYVLNDFIGTDAAGTVALPNSNGVLIQNGASGNQIGNTGAGDLISGNYGDGVQIVGSGTSSNSVEDDDIGTTYNDAIVDDSAGLGNGQNGVSISGGATGNTIGVHDVIAANFLAGVLISDPGTSRNFVEGDFIGTDLTGTKRLANEYGVVIQNGSTDNTVGGDSSTARNVISGNTDDGVHILGSGTSGNLVAGNDIGVAVGGSADLGNGQSGVAILGGASSNAIGGSTGGMGNVISDNGDAGVYMSDGGTTNNSVEGNDIGTDSTGTVAVPNAMGVYIGGGATNNQIGGTRAGARNVISGNTGDGVHIVDSGTSGNVVEGDYIGINANGTVLSSGKSPALPNGASGVAIYAGASGNTIGGTVAGSGDVISGNTGDGFYISSGGTSGNVVDGDDIGTDDTGTLAVPNNLGVYIGGGATNNTIGGTIAAARDVISANSTDGIQMLSIGTAGNVVEGDYIGVNAHDTTLSNGQGAALPNGQNGVLIDGGANNDIIGGTVAGSLNVISGNTGSGVVISDPGTVGNVVEGDDIGYPVGNGLGGVLIQNGATDNTIGGSVTGARDVISGNTGNGVIIYGGGTNDNVVAGDLIGLSPAGNGTFANTSNGVLIDAGASDNTIGGTSADAADTISGNTDCGVLISDSGTNGNAVEHDFIGVSANGASVQGNGTGVAIVNGAQSNTIGSSYGAGDIIAGNSTGVIISDSGTSDNAVVGCYVGTNAAGATNLGNLVDGILVENGATDDSIAMSHIEHNGYNGIELDGGDTTGIYIWNDDIDSNSGNGIDFDGAAFNTVYNCTIDNNSELGILDQGNGNDYGSDENNTIQGNGYGSVNTIEFPVF